MRSKLKSKIGATNKGMLVALSYVLNHRGFAGFKPPDLPDAMSLLSSLSLFATFSGYQATDSLSVSGLNRCQSLARCCLAVGTAGLAGLTGLDNSERHKAALARYDQPLSYLSAQDCASAIVKTAEHEKLLLRRMNLPAVPAH